jgi:hypothetical protein
MTPEQMRILQTIMAIRSSKTRDASSATLDPVLAFLTQNYQQTPQMSDEQIEEMYAPTLLSLSTSNLGDSRAEAARRIVAGENPFDVAESLAPPKGFDPGRWSDFVQSLSKERVAVQRQKAERDLAPDHFQKQGLPGYGEKYSDEQLLERFPSAFADIAGRRAPVSEQSILQDILAKRIVADPKPKEPGPGILSQANRAFRRVGGTNPGGWIASGRDIVGGIAGLFRDEPTGPGTVDPEAPLTTAQRRKLDRRKFAVGGEGYERLKAQERVRNVRGGLEAEGRSPLMDALLMNAMLERLL